MGKVNLCIKYCLRNEKIEYNIKGILQDKKLKYKNDNALMIIDMEKYTLNRIKDNEEYLFDFIKEKCIINHNDINVSIPIKVLNKKFNNKMISVKYQINDDNYEINIKIMEEK